MVSFGHWVVIVDVAPTTTYLRVERALRDMGFEEVLPCVFTDRWRPPRKVDIEKRIKRIMKGGVGRVLVCRTGRTPPFWIAGG